MSQEIKLRRACLDDSAFLLALRNQPETRLFSFSSTPVSLENHQQWLQAKLSDIAAELYIAELDNQPIGQVRFEQEENHAEVSIAVSEAFHGRGLGTKILRKACQQFFDSNRDSRLIAHIKPENAASIKMFANVGFQDTQSVECKGHPCLQMSLTCKTLMQNIS